MQHTTGPGGERNLESLEAIAGVLEQMLIAHKTDGRKALEEIVDIKGASPEVVRAARFMASAAVYLAAASEGKVDDRSARIAEADVRFLRSLCVSLEFRH